jgi:glycosyltransferase involved in cell wall biosynthesis
MNLSVIVPAYNEEKYLAATLEHIRAACSGLDNVDIIIVDNDSTDRTRDVAEKFGARIITEHEHNIGKVRNTGAANASGELLIFVDADTLVDKTLFRKIVEVMEDEKCFGGSVNIRYAAAKRIWVRYYLMMWLFLGRLFRMQQGAAQFSRKRYFDEIGGYDASIYIGEDVDLGWRLVKLAREKGGYTTFIEDPPVITSPRRYARMGLIRTLLITHPITIFLFWRTRSVWKDWYENAVR